jgi:hypothetical protein
VTLIVRLKHNCVLRQVSEIRRHPVSSWTRDIPLGLVMELYVAIFAIYDDVIKALVLCHIAGSLGGRVLTRSWDVACEIECNYALSLFDCLFKLRDSTGWIGG